MLSVQILLTTELHELFRIPVFIEHYLDHRNQDHSISILDFITQHYSGNQPCDEDKEEDAELPFKSRSEISVSTSLSVVIPQPFQHQLFKKYHLVAFNSPDDDDLTDQKFAVSIWQPPKAC